VSILGDAGTVGVWVGAGLAALLLIVALVALYKQRMRKVLAFRAYTEFPLVTAGSMTSKIDILANGQKLESPHLLLFTLRSSGNEAVRPEDFESPLSISFVDAELIETELRTSDDTFDVAHSSAGLGRIDFSPFLLNPGEGFVLTALVDGCPHELQVAAHVAGGQLRDDTEGTVTQMLTASVLRGISLSLPFVGSVQLRRPDTAHGVPTHRHRP